MSSGTEPKHAALASSSWSSSDSNNFSADAHGAEFLTSVRPGSFGLQLLPADLKKAADVGPGAYEFRKFMVLIFLLPLISIVPTSVGKASVHVREEVVFLRAYFTTFGRDVRCISLKRFKKCFLISASLVSEPFPYALRTCGH